MIAFSAQALAKSRLTPLRIDNYPCKPEILKVFDIFVALYKLLPQNDCILSCRIKCVTYVTLKEMSLATMDGARIMTPIL